MKQDYFLEKVQQNELMSTKHKEACRTLNYIEHFPILASKITGSILIFDFCIFAWYSYRN